MNFRSNNSQPCSSHLNMEAIFIHISTFLSLENQQSSTEIIEKTATMTYTMNHSCESHSLPFNVIIG